MFDYLTGLIANIGCTKTVGTVRSSRIEPATFRIHRLRLVAARHIYARVLTLWTSSLRRGEHHLHSLWRRVRSPDSKAHFLCKSDIKDSWPAIFHTRAAAEKLSLRLRKNNLREGLKRPSKAFLNQLETTLI